MRKQRLLSALSSLMGIECDQLPHKPAPVPSHQEGLCTLRQNKTLTPCVASYWVILSQQHEKQLQHACLLLAGTSLTGLKP